MTFVFVISNVFQNSTKHLYHKNSFKTTLSLSCAKFPTLGTLLPLEMSIAGLSDEEQRESKECVMYIDDNKRR